MSRSECCTLVLLISTGLAPWFPDDVVAQDDEAELVQGPLFASNEVLTMEIVGPIEEIREDRSEEPEYRETLIRWVDNGSTTEVTARIRARGNFRRQKRTCRHIPPLRVNFRTKELEGTLFEGQDRLKLVTHCRDGEDYEQNVLEEYLAYRLYNGLSDESFRVRLAHITYTDPTNDRQDVRYGFLIEDEDRMAYRLGGEIVELPQLHPFLVAGDAEPRIALFQYMIGNTDFSLVSAHNVMVVRREGGDLVPVPYDFDWSGLVGAGYARPAETLGIRNVRQRVYRGFCHPDKSIPDLFPDFLALREHMDALEVEIEGWRQDDRKKAREYLDDFFEILEDRGKADREIVRRCREVLG